MTDERDEACERAWSKWRAYCERVLPSGTLILSGEEGFEYGWDLGVKHERERIAEMAENEASSLRVMASSTDIRVSQKVADRMLHAAGRLNDFAAKIREET